MVARPQAAQKNFFFVLLRSVRRAAGARERAVRAATAGSRRETEPWSPGGTTIKMTVGTPARNPSSAVQTGVSRSGNPKFFGSFLQFFGALANIELFKLNCDESKTAKYRKNRRFRVPRAGSERGFIFFFVREPSIGVFPVWSLRSPPGHLPEHFGRRSNSRSHPSCFVVHDWSVSEVVGRGFVSSHFVSTVSTRTKKHH